MSFPRYPEYKDSGVAWLGRVPEHWRVDRLKRNLSLLTEKSDSKTNPVALENIEGWSGRFIASETEFEGDGVRFDTGDILFGKLRPYLAKVLLAPWPGEAVGDFHVLRAKPSVFPRFAQYLMLTRSFIDIVDGSTFGSKMPRAGWEFVGDMPLPIPSFDEQKSIAAFLDRETAKIDDLVAEQEQLITLLKEKRQAVISHAVTKGLDPSVPMKDSGVEWLGEVPAHWGIGKVKQFFATSSGSTPNTDKQDVYYNGDIPWIRSLDLTDGDIVEWEVGITPAAIDDTACKLLPVGTVLVAMYGGDGTIGKNGLLRIPAATNQAICALLPSPQFEPEFVLAFMQHQRPYWMVGAEGTRKDPNISQDRVRNALMPCPSLSEQRVIVEQVKQALSAFGSLEKEAEAVIGILNERRSALISAAVTGQIDVRGLANQEAA
jgi:type I restriction enzyme S subunit